MNRTDFTQEQLARLDKSHLTVGTVTKPRNGKTVRTVLHRSDRDMARPQLRDGEAS